jgi:hypothetical protein
MHRTQIYLDSDLHRALTEEAEEAGTTLSDAIRSRLRQTLTKERLVDRVQAFRQAVGIWKDRDDLRDVQSYLRGLRKSTRMNRYGSANAKTPR